jgi:hypothetical protein
VLLQAGLARAGFGTVLLETRRVKAALSAMSIKTDRNDARGIAQLMRMGWFRPADLTSPGLIGAAGWVTRIKQVAVGLANLQALTLPVLSWRGGATSGAHLKGSLVR